MLFRSQHWMDSPLSAQLSWPLIGKLPRVFYCKKLETINEVPLKIRLQAYPLIDLRLINLQLNARVALFKRNLSFAPALNGIWIPGVGNKKSIVHYDDQWWGIYSVRINYNKHDFAIWTLCSMLPPAGWQPPDVLDRIPELLKRQCQMMEG